MDVLKRVANGAAWLDENEPGWEGRIDLAVLALDSGCRCVLGQVTPERSFLYAMARIHGADFDWWDTPWAFEHGFNLSPSTLANRSITFGPLYAELDEAWISLIKERHDSGNLSGVR